MKFQCIEYALISALGALVGIFVSRCVASYEIKNRYFLINVITAVLFCACWSMPLMSQKLAGMIFSCLLLIGVLIDYKCFILPDSITVGGAMIGLLVAVLMPSVFGHGQYSPQMINSFYAIRDSVLGLMVGTGSIIWIAILAEKCFKKEAMGFGDALFCGMIGTFIGWQGALFSIFGGSVLGVVLLGIFWGLEKLFNIRLIPRAPHAAVENEDIRPEDVELQIGVIVPFGPFLGLGAMVYLFLDERIGIYWS